MLVDVRPSLWLYRLRAGALRLYPPALITKAAEREEAAFAPGPTGAVFAALTWKTPKPPKRGMLARRAAAGNAVSPHQFSLFRNPLS